MERRRFIDVIAGGLLAVPLAAEAQQAANNLSANPRGRDAFCQGLRDLGYVEGGNVVIEYRDAEGNLERLPALAVERVALRADVLVPIGAAATQAARNATKTLPIAGAAIGAPVQASPALQSSGTRPIQHTGR